MAEKITGMSMGAKWTAWIARGVDGKFTARVVIGERVRVTGQISNLEACKDAAKTLAVETIKELRGGGGDDGADASAS